jgi:glucose/arabinose dehydrogenase
VITFGPDDKLYIFIGDVGRRGQLQNLPVGPFGPGQPDDQFGGPEPDDAHLTGVILRLNNDGTAPTDNPFFAVGAAMGGEVGANLQKSSPTAIGIASAWPLTRWPGISGCRKTGTTPSVS